MEKTKIVVMVEGGVVYDILSNVPTDILILDADVEGADEERIAKITLLDDEGNISRMVEENFVSARDVPATPYSVDYYFREAEGVCNAEEMVSEVRGTEGASQ